MFGPLATTMMFCADTMDVEDRFLRTLADVRGFRVSGPRLELLGASGEPMAVFEAGEPPASA